MAKLLTQRPEVSFRSQTSSSKYNNQQNNIQNDLYTLLDKITKTADMLTKVNQNFGINNIFQQTMIQQLKAQVFNLNQKIDNLEIADITGKYIKSKNCFSHDFSLNFEDVISATSQEIPAEIKVSEGFVSLPAIKKVNKTNIISIAGKEYVPKEIVFDVKSSTNGQLTIGDVDNILVNSLSRIWEAEIAYSDNTAHSPLSETIQVTFNLPTEIMHEKRVNTIRINPYPAYGVEIANVELEVGNVYKQIPGFQQENNMMGIREWRFESQYAEKVRITLKQSTPVTIDNVIKYVFGIQHLDISYQEYSSSEHFVISKFDMSEEGIYTINKIEHSFLNDSALTPQIDKWVQNEIYRYDIYIKQQDGRFIKIPDNQWSDMTYEEIWVKTILKRDEQTLTPPCLEKVTLLYESH